MSMTIEECAAPRAALPVPDTPSSVYAQLSLKDRICLVTGASGGLGKAAAEAFAEAGAHLVLWYNASPTSAESLAADLRSTHAVRALTAQVDVSDPLAVQRGISAAVEAFGRLDVVVANAGMAISKPLLEMDVEEVRRLNGVNAEGVVWCAKYAGEVFQRQGKGNLIITGSISAHVVNVPVDQPVGHTAISTLILFSPPRSLSFFHLIFRMEGEGRGRGRFCKGQKWE